MQKNSVNNRTCHIHIKYWQFRENLGEAKGIVIQYINLADNIGDIFTKGTKAELYVTLCKNLMGWQMYLSFWEEVLVVQYFESRWFNILNQGRNIIFDLVTLYRLRFYPTG